jgi:hypothetical protein
MQQNNNQNYSSIAWFKLAELVMRKEREKALSVYRLLSHSFENRAYALQLEGDILWYLDDKSCTEKYKEAALLYHKEKAWFDAVAVYEHLHTVAPSPDHITVLLRYYTLVDWPEKAQQCFDQFQELIKQKKIDELFIINGIKSIVDDDQFINNKARRQWLWSTGDQFFHSLSSSTGEQLERLLK